MAAEDKDLNRDPITDEPGSHPVGTGVGATGGAVAGAAAGAVGGPVGVAVGGVVGAVVGGLAGKATAEAVNPTAEEAHWRENYTSEPYYEQGRSFDDYAPAYRLGLTGRTRYEGDWESAEPQLASEWESARGGSSLSWPQAQPGQPRRLGPHRAIAWATCRHGRRAAAWPARAKPVRAGRRAMVGEIRARATTRRPRRRHRRAERPDRDLQGRRVRLQGLRRTGQARGREVGVPAARRRLPRRRTGTAEQIRSLGGNAKEGGSAMGAVERGWVAVKATLSTYDDKAVLEECERGEDNAVARYRKALKKPLPAGIKLIVERQMQGVQRNHDQIKMLRDQFRASA